jgi:hypothetical protein
MLNNLYNFRINYVSFLNLGLMKIVLIIFYLLIIIFITLFYNINLFVTGCFIIYNIIIFFDIKFSYVEFDNISIFYKKFYSTSLFQRLGLTKNIKQHYSHPIILDFYKINNKIYQVDVNLTHIDQLNGVRNIFVCKDKKGDDVYVVLSDMKIVEVRNKIHSLELAENLNAKFKNFEITDKQNVEHLFNHVQSVIRLSLEKKFNTDIIYSLTNEEISSLEKKIFLLRNESLFNVEL